MFGDVEDATIRTVLEANGGHMEHTVNDLLQMTGDPAGSAEVEQERRNVAPPVGTGPSHGSFPAAGSSSSSAEASAEARARALLSSQGSLPTGFLQTDAGGSDWEAGGTPSGGPRGFMAVDDRMTRTLTDEELAAALQNEEYQSQQQEREQMRREPVSRAPFAGLFGRARGAASAPAGDDRIGERTAGNGIAGPPTQGATAARGSTFSWSTVKRVFTDASDAAKAKAHALSTKCMPQRRNVESWMDDEEDGLMEDSLTNPRSAHQGQQARPVVPPVQRYDPPEDDLDSFMEEAINEASAAEIRRRRNHDRDGL